MAANMQRVKVRLGDLLVEKKLISENQLQAALLDSDSPYIQAPLSFVDARLLLRSSPRQYY